MKQSALIVFLLLALLYPPAVSATSAEPTMDGRFGGCKLLPNERL